MPSHSPSARDLVLDCAVYVDGARLDDTGDFAQAYQRVRATGRGFVWLGLHSPTAARMASVARVFNLHSLVVEDLVDAHQRPKLELYDGTVFLVLRSMHYVDHAAVDKANDIVSSGEIMVLAGPDFVITVRHGNHTQLGGVRAALESRPEALAFGPVAVLHAVADHVVDSYQRVAIDMADDVDELEEHVFASSTTDLDIDVVYMFKREILELHRAVAPLAVPLAWLSGAAGPGSTLRAELPGAFGEKEIRRHFRDVADHLTAAVDMIDGYDERLTTLLNAAATKVGIQQNTDMRKISSWAAIAVVPTAIAGIYGMNFEHMPELAWRWSYPAVLLLLLLICTTLWVVLHKNRWL
ncbi:MAG: magnesium and cobalt transport protein CorA [Gordonia sp. (in: high G+C Gram-positive bacteria)]|uniref:magnesium and cobalt transport protein CorA n=1 Tax=Gordonia sp. (in: high G+C Gram-positive bacteria) TaxID=84139 RepID=UPI003BB629F4